MYYGYDIPELKFTAMIEHARVLVEEKKPDDAVKLLEKVIEDAPKDSEWTKAAQERLEKLKKVINRARNRDGEVEDSVDNGTELQRVSRHGVIRGGGTRKFKVEERVVTDARVVVDPMNWIRW